MEPHGPRAADPTSIRALILAGGLGTRLRAVLGQTPKPMALVADRPFLDYLLRQLERDGFRHVVLLTGHGGDEVERYFRSADARELEVAYSRERAPLGTGGAVRLAVSRFPEARFLVMNGDSFFDIPLGSLVSAHAASDAVLTMALAHVDARDRYGGVDLDEEGRVVRFAEKGGSASGTINAGIYVIERGVVGMIDAERPVSLEREILPALVGRGLRGVAYEGAFVDIGVPADYQALRDAPAALLGSVL